MHFQVALGVCSQSVLAHARNLYFTSPEGEGFQPSPKETLKTKGYDGYVVEANVKGQTYYRVRVGRLPNREEAESTRQSLGSTPRKL